jgi:hypothetical protein
LTFPMRCFREEPWQMETSVSSARGTGYFAAAREHLDISAHQGVRPDFPRTITASCSLRISHSRRAMVSTNALDFDRGSRGLKRIQQWTCRLRRELMGILLAPLMPPASATYGCRANMPRQMRFAPGCGLRGV